MRRIVGALLLIAGLVGAFFAVGIVMEQHRAIQHNVPVDAVVLYSDVTAKRSRKSTTYTPVVRYRYEAGGRVYESDRIAPFSESGGSSWATGIRNAYPVGKRVKAYVDPADATNVILVREYSGTPYVLSCAAVMVAGAGLLLLLGVGAGLKEMQTVMLDPAGWQLLMPAQSVKRRKRNAILGLVIMGLPVVMLAGHFLYVGRIREVMGWVLLVLAGAALLWQIVTVYRAWSLSKHMSDPRVEVLPAPMRIGEPFGIRVEVDAYSPLDVTGMRARAVCMEHYRERSGNKTQTGVRDRGEEVVELSGPTSVGAGGLLSGTGEVSFEVGQWPATFEGAKVYPYYTWELRLEVDLRGKVDFRGKFPLTAVCGRTAAQAAG